MTATIDEALEILEGTGPEFGGGLSNHGPMAAEALLALGRPDAVIPWTENYKRRLRDHPDSRNPIGEDWREALGDGRRVGDWIAFFDRQLAEARWRDVLNVWVPRLAPGLVAAATHGVIRTGHAVRSVGAQETPARLRELAEGLGYWATRYMTLPDAAPATSGDRLPSQALRMVETVPPGHGGVGLIVEGLRQLDGFPPFASAAALVDVSPDPSSFVSDLTETFAGVYLANATHTGLVITFIHSVTGPSAVRLMAPYLDDEALRICLRYGWQAAAALYAAFAQASEAPSMGDPSIDQEDLIDRAVASGDEHAIKFTEACLREYALNPKPVYLAAARHSSNALGARAR